jgi:hypothetical protein
LATIEEAWSAHGQDLAGMPSPRQRAEILTTWRRAIDQDAHDYADLVAANPQRGQILEWEADTIVNAYLCGVMARRGWISEVDARQAAHALGRALRDRLRDTSVQLDSLNPVLGTVMTDALESIVELGLETDVSGAVLDGA